MSEPESIPLHMKIHGDALTSLMREAAEQGDIITLFDLIPGCLSSVENVRLIIQLQAEIFGDDENGYGIRATTQFAPIDFEALVESRETNLRKGAYRAGYEDALEGITRWAKAEGHSTVANELEDGTWEDPGEEEEDDDDV